MNDARSAAGRTPLASARTLARFAVPVLALAGALPVHAQEPADEPITLVGRFLLPDGAPAVGATFVIRGRQASPDRVEKYGLPADYEDPAPVATGEDGRFEVSFVPPRAFYFAGEATLEGHVEAEWRWFELEPGTKKDLGDTTFELPGVLEGSILDADGNTLIGTWRVTAEAKRRGRSDGRLNPRASASPDPETGIFRLGGLPAGEVEVSASDRGRARIAERPFEVVAGKVTRIALEYDGPSLASQISVTVRTRPLVVDVPADSIVLESSIGEAKRAHRVRGSPLTYRFDDVEPGEYEVVIQDPRYRVWRRTGVKNGDNIDAHLEGNAGVRFALVDPEGEPVREYGLRVDYHRSGSSPREFQLAQDGTKHESIAYFGKLVAPDLTLIARVDGWPELDVVVEGLEPNETREITATLARGVELAGRTVGPDGAPLAGVIVEYTRGERAGHALGANGSMTTPEGPVPPKNGDATTDAEGRFRIEGVAPGPWTLRARFSDWMVVDRTVELRPEGAEDVILTSPGSGWLAARVEIPEGASMEPIDLTVRIDTMPSSMSFRRPGDDPLVATDGSFRFGPLPAGQVNLRILFKVFDEDGSGWSSSQVDQREVTIVAGETTEEVVDLRETYPGSVRARVRIDGEPAGGVYVWPGGRPGEPARGGRTLTADREGLVRLDGLSAGEWHLCVKPKDGSWWWTSGPLVVPVAGEIEVDLDVRLAKRRVRFLDASSGEPLARRAVVARIGEDWSASEQESTTNGEGYATFVLCDGTVHFQDGKSKEVETTDVEWRVDGDGPGDVRLAVVPD